MRKPVAALTTLALLTPLTQLPLPVAAADDLASRFTLGVMPDTQFYARYGTDAAGDIFGSRYGSNPFDVQTKFLADNHEALGTEFVTHLGDLVDQPEDLASWDIADRAMAVLDQANLDYSVLPGNHDYAMLGGASAFETYFPVSRAEQLSTFKGRHQSTDVYAGGKDYKFPGQTVDSEYHIFEAEGQEYLVLALGFRANDDTLAWAQEVIDAHPTLPVILTAHEITGINGDGSTYFTKEYGQHLWDALIRKNDQIFLTIAGHHHGAGYHVTTNDAGHDVINILQDYQMAYLGGNGLMGLLQFDLSNNQLEMTAFSPWVQQKDTAKLTAFDHLLLEGSGDSYAIDIDFDARFAGFNEAWTKGDENDPNYSAILRDTVSKGYTPYTITETEKPAGPDDYVKVEGTTVHWRPGRTTFEGQLLNDGQAAPAGSVIPDVQSGQDMTRVKNRAGVSDNLVTYSTDTHPLSSDSGSLKFAEPNAKSAVAWFETATGAKINSMNFENGYTMEAFLKLDKDFDGDDNGWSNALIRDASGTKVNPQDPDGDPIQMLGVSNLRELRWYSLGENGKGFSNWTHEVPKGEWMHVAVVNDPKDKSVTMYVDGSPILRDGYGPVGMAGEEYKWLLGTSAWEDKMEDGWFGSIGEIRIVDRPIGEDQWLTARAPKTAPSTPSTPSASSTPTSEAPASASPSTSASASASAEPTTTSGGSRFLSGVGAVISQIIGVLGGALSAIAAQLRNFLRI
ncbi:LamG-like jellyroll fold domain-containing protein [Corynebacterium glaucum]|uniref:LamG-like jellyroll fold domain-containing protein n=1 Tax=Corynebacterium glaucum TaxID=187491 RepID=UPI0026588511|nr:LamG-like jellyroll fold domain-containing protein [Corynebacterium glaucum]